MSFFWSPCAAHLSGVIAGAAVVLRADYRDAVKGGVGGAVAAAVESVAVSASGRRGYRSGAAEVGERRLRAKAFGIVAHRRQEARGRLRAVSVDGHEVGRGLGGKCAQLGVVLINFPMELLVAAGQAAQGELGSGSGVGQVCGRPQSCTRGDEVGARAGCEAGRAACRGR